MEWRRPKIINNDFYDDLNDGWYNNFEHPVAFLRAGHALRTPWILANLSPNRKVIDIGCGAGMLSNVLAKAGHHVTGVDLSANSLNIAKERDATHTVRYLNANAYSLPFQDGEFDAVCIMDVLEHVEEPGLLIGEASRVLKSKGSLFFHTFNRTILSYFLIIKAIDWFLPNPPRRMHLFPLFIKPEELEDMFELYKLNIQSIEGIRPLFSKAFWKVATSRRVPNDFAFRFCRTLRVGYCGIARKRGTLSLR